MTVLNEEQYCEYSIKSVLPLVDELIIVDNCSDDKSSKIIESIKSEKIKFIKLPKRQSYAYCVKFALDNISGNYVLRSDADMIFSETNLSEKIGNHDGIFFQAINLFGDCFNVDKEKPYKTNIFIIKKEYLKFDEKFVYLTENTINDNDYTIWHMGYCKTLYPLYLKLFNDYLDDYKAKEFQIEVMNRAIPICTDPPPINSVFKMKMFDGKMYYETSNLSPSHGTSILTLTILVRNTEIYLKECLTSVFKQTSDRWKIVMVNDYSDLGPINLDLYIDNEYAAFKDRIKVINLDEWHGLPRAHSVAISHVDTEIIGVLDSDDTLELNAIEEVLKIYDNANEEIFVYTNYWRCDKDLKQISFGYSTKNKNSLLNDRCASHFRTFLKKTYDKIDGYDPELFMGAIDQDLFFQLEMYAKPYYLNMYLYNYRYTGMVGTITSMKGANSYMLWISIFKNICRRYGNNKFSIKKLSGNEYINSKSFYLFGPSKNNCYYEVYSHDIYLFTTFEYEQEGDIDLLWDNGWKIVPFTGTHSYDSKFMVQLRKMTVNLYFNCVYVLNLKKDTKKRERMERILNKLGIKYVIFDAVYGKDYPEEYSKTLLSPGAYGYTMTMKNIIEDAKKKGYKKILTLDDDVIFHNDFIDKFDEFIRKIPHDWYLLFLGLSGPWTHPWVNPDFQRFTFDKVFVNNLFNCDGSYAVGYDNRVFDEIIEVTQKFEKAFDTAMIKHFTVKYLKKCFAFYPYLAIADTTSSDITERAKDIRENFNDYQFKYRVNLNAYDLKSLDHQKYEKLKYS